jgi:signal transduction histidine kinase
MLALVYVRLIGFTAGTLLHLFWLVVILGYRRPRTFEKVFFFLALSLFLFYSGSLLALNAEIYYSQPPAALVTFAATLLGAGLCLLPPLLVYLHAEYAEVRGLIRHRDAKRLLIWTMFIPTAYFGLRVYPLLAAGGNFDFLLPGNELGVGYGVWFAASMVVSLGWEYQFARQASDKHQQWFHRGMVGFFAIATGLVLYLHVLGGPRQKDIADVLGTVVLLLGLLPGALLIYAALRFNFLQIGRQKNLVYAVSATFLALLYLSAVRRVGTWLEPVLPPEATAAILLFVLVVFFEPLQRVLGRALKQSLQEEVDRLQRLTGEIQQEARQGDLERLVRFVERRVREEFELADARMELWDTAKAGGSQGTSLGPKGTRRLEGRLPANSFALRQDEGLLGVLHTTPHGAFLSGEARAALEFLSEQLPAMIGLCRLIEEKLKLERELAERERLALVGQMAASISHNLKNPLGAMKTILQVQLENPDLPQSARTDCELVLAEIERLNAKLHQLLRFSRPAVRPGSAAPRVDLRMAAEQAVGVLRHEAEHRGTAVAFQAEEEELSVCASAEGLNDILTNLLVNAMEALGHEGHIWIRVRSQGGWAVLEVEDDGPGIPAALRERILKPFFTTKPQGTGLGLAIVARRVSEMQGRLEWQSPTATGRGVLFTIRLPVVASKVEGKTSLAREAV